VSLLIFVHNAEQVVLLTDTLATTTDGAPFIFTSKCWPVPHMRLVMAGTGVAALHEAWYRRLQTGVLARDIDMVALHTPVVLRQLWAELQVKHGPLSVTSTVYHFGIPEGEQHFVRYAFRSDSDFTAERADNGGIGVKPVPGFDFDSTGSLEDLIGLAERIREEQDRRPASERIYIGGELILTILTSASSTVTTVHRFADFDEMWQAMNDRRVG
jgi:hypothetical protein